MSLALLSGWVSSVPVTPDALRLLIVLAFFYGAVLDYRSRRIYNEFWMPLIGLCFIVLGWDLIQILVSNPGETEKYLFTLSISILIVPSIAYTLWEEGMIGGADLKALSFLSVFFPVAPDLFVAGTSYPIVEGITPIFAVTVLVNALMISSLYRVVLVGQNIMNADLSSVMTRAVRCETDSVPEKHGDILCREGNGTKSVDIDAIRMYLQWRGITLKELRSNATYYKATQPKVGHGITDGSFPKTGNTPLGHSRAEYRPRTSPSENSTAPIGVNEETDDAWAAERFVECVDQHDVPASVSPGQLRTGLDVLSNRGSVWVSPSIPFFVPLTVGLIIALVYGSLFTGSTEFIASVLVDYLTA